MVDVDLGEKDLTPVTASQPMGRAPTPHPREESSYLSNCFSVGACACSCLTRTAADMAERQFWYGQYQQNREDGNREGAAFAAGQSGTTGGTLGAYLAPGYTNREMEQQHQIDGAIINGVTTCCTEIAKGCGTAVNGALWLLDQCGD